MGNEISSYDTDPIISGNEKVIGSDDNGDTANYSINDIAVYAQTEGTGRMAIYDGASDVKSYEEEVVIGTSLPLRLDLTGPLTEGAFFPSKYGDVMSNQDAAPAATSIDFRFFAVGVFIEFDIEFNIECEGTGGTPLQGGEIYHFDLVATFPNNKTETKSIQVKASDNQGPAGTLTSYVKLRFATYMPSGVLGNLLGGGFELFSRDGNTTDIYTVRDLMIRVMI